MKTVAIILLTWFVVSIPVSLLVGRILGRLSRHEAAFERADEAWTANVPAASTASRTETG